MTKFQFSYNIRNFMALETQNQSNNTWSDEFRGTLLSCTLDNIESSKISNHYEGKIGIHLSKLEQSSIIIGQDVKTWFQPHSTGGHGPLPTATFEFAIEINNLDSDTISALEWILNETASQSWERIIGKRANQFQSLFTQSVDGEIASRLGRFQWQRLKQMEAAFRMFGPLQGGMIGNGIKIDQGHILEVFQSISKMVKDTDKDGKLLRSQMADYLELKKDLKKSDSTNIADIQRIEIIEGFGTDLFLIFRHYMNLIIRFLRYERQQFWLNELTVADGGFFYVNNEVRMDGKGPLIPLAKSHHHSALLSPEYTHDVDTWKRVTMVMNNESKLMAASGNFTLGGIFSQATLSVEDGHLENAIILALIGLEAAMTDVLVYLEGDSGAKGYTGEKVGRIKGHLENRSFQTIKSAENESLWRLIEGIPKEGYRIGDFRNYEDGLIPIRNSIQHEKATISPRKQRRVVEYVSAARKMAYYLSKGLDTLTEGDLNKCEVSD